MNKIIDNLWITDIQTVAEESTEQFDMVISVCQDKAADNVSVPYVHFPLADGPDDSRWGGDYSYGFFAAIVDFVVDQYNCGSKLLVHCHRGRSRSAAVCICTIGELLDSSFKGAHLDVDYARETDLSDMMGAYTRFYMDGGK